MDSTFDRWGEAVVYIGILWGALQLGYQLPVLLTGAAMVAAFMVSYTRAKSESLGFVPGTGMANVGLPRARSASSSSPSGSDRAGLAGTPPASTAAGLIDSPLGVLILDAALGLIAVLATITVIQRIVVDHQPGINAGTGVTAAHGAGAREQEREERPRRAQSARQEDPRRHRRRRQLREQPRPGPLLLRERQGRPTSSRG